MNDQFLDLMKTRVSDIPSMDEGQALKIRALVDHYIGVMANSKGFTENFKSATTGKLGALNSALLNRGLKSMKRVSNTNHIETTLSHYSDEIDFYREGDKYVIIPKRRSSKVFHLFYKDKEWTNPKSKRATRYPYKSISHFIDNYVLEDAYSRV